MLYSYHKQHIGGQNLVKNNIEVDVKVKLLKAGKTQQQLGEEIGTTGQYINRVLKKNGGIVNDTFVKMMDALGYNIVLTYEKKD